MGGEIVKRAAADFLEAFGQFPGHRRLTRPQPGR